MNKGKEEGERGKERKRREREEIIVKTQNFYRSVFEHAEYIRYIFNK